MGGKPVLANLPTYVRDVPKGALCRLVATTVCYYL
jgi:hypothetical protein